MKIYFMIQDIVCLYECFMGTWKTCILLLTINANYGILILFIHCWMWFSWEFFASKVTERWWSVVFFFMLLFVWFCYQGNAYQPYKMSWKLSPLLIGGRDCIKLVLLYIFGIMFSGDIVWSVNFFFKSFWVTNSLL